jgi:hypothetical protein
MGRWETFMVHDHLWDSAGMTDGFLCIGCLEKRLGRQLCRNDFPPLPIAKVHPWDTPRLALRKKRATEAITAQGAPTNHHLEPFAAPLHLPEALNSHRESDDAYPAVVQLDAKTRVINCRDNIQWILQRKRGDQWYGIAYCRIRDALIREAKRQLGLATEPLNALPQRCDGLIDDEPRCDVCGRIKSGPDPKLPRHLFCIAERKGFPHGYDA